MLIYSDFYHLFFHHIAKGKEEKEADIEKGQPITNPESDELQSFVNILNYDSAEINDSLEEVSNDDTRFLRSLARNSYLLQTAIYISLSTIMF